MTGPAGLVWRPLSLDDALYEREGFRTRVQQAIYVLEI